MPCPYTLGHFRWKNVTNRKNEWATIWLKLSTAITPFMSISYVVPMYNCNCFKRGREINLFVWIFRHFFQKTTTLNINWFVDCSIEMVCHFSFYSLVPFHSIHFLSINLFQGCGKLSYLFESCIEPCVYFVRHTPHRPYLLCYAYNMEIPTNWIKKNQSISEIHGKPYQYWGIYWIAIHFIRIFGNQIQRFWTIR